jgi:hypothetical protein
MEIYFDLEIGYENEKIIDKLRNGLKVSFNPAACKIITIQYQLLNDNGTANGPLRIFKEWESSEEEIIRKIFNILNPARLWEFIPVGYNIYFDLGVFKERAKLYGLEYSDWFIYHELPSIDIKHICLGMNAFRFKDSGLNKFTGKETTGVLVPVWYHQKEYNKIINYIKKEAAEFIEFYVKLKQKLPEFRKQHGFF